MKKAIAFIFIFVLLVSGSAFSVSAGTVVIDDFNSYGSDSDLKGVWKFEVGDPMPMTLESTAVDEGKAMKLTYTQQSLCFANVCMKEKIINVPANATGIEMWVKNDGDPFVLAMNYRSEPYEKEYIAKFTIPKTSGQFVGFKFSDSLDAKTKQPAVMDVKQFINVGFCLTMEFQATYDNFVPKTFYVDSLRFTTDGDAPSEESPSSTASIAEQPESETSVGSVPDAPESRTAESESGIQVNASMIFMIIAIAALAAIAAVAVFIVIFIKKQNKS